MPGTTGIADAIVVAAGSSRRMDGVDKLAHEVAGRPLLAWSIDALAASDAVERIVVVTAPDRVAAIAGARGCAERVVAVVAGGDRRQSPSRPAWPRSTRSTPTDDRRASSSTTGRGRCRPRRS